VQIRWSGSSTTTRWNGFLHRQIPDPVRFEIVEAEDGITALGAFAITMPDIVVLAPPEPSGWGNQDAFLTELQVAKTRAVDRVPEHARDREQEQS
jgi:hypothetical protein